MNLNNDTMVLLSKFAVKAKKHIGLVELKKVFTNRRYANNILLKARLSDDEELSSLTKIVSQELNFNVLEIAAIESYINMLSERGESIDFIESSKYFLIILANYLYGARANGASYRQAVGKMILHADFQERTLYIKILREFYPFWISQHKLSSEKSNPITIKPNTSENEFMEKAFSGIWNIVDIEYFSEVETESLDQYAASLQDQGVSSEHVKIKLRFAKIIIKELRNEGGGIKNYRKAVNQTQHLFTRHDLQELFLLVSREFYRFWAGIHRTE